MTATNYASTMKKRSLLLMPLFAAVITVGCDNKMTASEKLDRVEAKTADVARDVKDYTFAQKEEFVTKMRSELAELNRELDKLTADVERSSAAVKADAKPRIDALRDRTARLNERLDEAANATESGWNEFKADVHKAYAGSKEDFNQFRQWLSKKIAP